MSFRILAYWLFSLTQISLPAQTDPPYVVEIAEYTQPVPLSLFDGLGKVSEKSINDSAVRYFIADIESREDAVQLRNRALRYGFRRARIMKAIANIPSPPQSNYEEVSPLAYALVPVSLPESVAPNHVSLYTKVDMPDLIFNAEDKDNYPTPSTILPGFDVASYALDTTSRLPVVQGGQVIRTYRLLFEFDRDALLKDARLTLDSVGQYLAMYPRYQIEIRAHTDIRGSELYNIQLSERRRDAVVEYLLALGVNFERIESHIFGNQTPLLPEADTKALHRLNRRVELVIKRPLEE